MNEKEKDALIQVKHFNNITRYWQEEEYEEKEIKKYITTILNLIERQDKMIEYMAKMLVEDHEYFFSKFDDYTAEDFIKYFEKKVMSEKPTEEKKVRE